MKLFPIVLVALGFVFDASALQYHWEASLEGTITRCFSSKEMKVYCDGDAEGKKSPTQELQIEAADRGNRYLYGYLKMIEGPLCEEHLRAIRRLMKGVDQVCVTGWGETLIDKTLMYHWSGLETKRGEIHR